MPIREFCEKYKVDRIFADKHGEWIARREMINYLREGDEVVVEDVAISAILWERSG